MDTLIYMERHQRLRRCRHGALLYNALDGLMARTLDHYGEHLENRLFALTELIQPGQVVVEVGAHIGAHTVAMGRRVGTEGMVLALEPQRLPFQNLCANLSLQGLATVVPLNIAAGAEDGLATVPQLNPATAHDSYATRVDRDDRPGLPVPRKRLDDMDLEALDTLVIDVGGGAAEVIRGARGVIAQSSPVIYVDAHSPEHAPALIQALFDLDYTLYWHITRPFNPMNFFDARENIFGDQFAYGIIGEKGRASPNLAGLERVSAPDQWFELGGED